MAEQNNFPIGPRPEADDVDGIGSLLGTAGSKKATRLSDFDIRFKVIKLLSEGKIPTRNMFFSDEEYNKALKDFELITYLQTDEGKKDQANKRLLSFMGEVETAKERPMAASRIFEGSRSSPESIIEKLTENDNYVASRLRELQKDAGKLKEAGQVSPSGGINLPSASMMMDTTTSAYGDAGRRRKVPEYKLLNKGGRAGYQTGGITETRTLPPEYVEALGKTYAADLTRQAGIPSITTATTQQPGETAEQFAQRQAQAQQFGITRAGMAELAPQVAAQDALQTAAYTQATDPSTGLGAYQPFLTQAQTAATGATALTGPMTTAQTTAYMSPYQSQVIDATLTEFDRQAQIRENQQAAATLGIPGAFGGGREGVQRAEYQSASDRNRAAIQSNLLQQGFQQAQAARQQDLANQMGISQLQSGLGARAQDFSRAQISGLGTLGAQQQAQSQAVLDAQRQAAQMAVDDPRRRLSMLGQGVAGLSGLGSVQIGDAPQAAQASPLTTALGLGLAGADIYGRIFKN
jgi:hypothetical protein